MAAAATAADSAPSSPPPQPGTGHGGSSRRIAMSGDPTSSTAVAAAGGSSAAPSSSGSGSVQGPEPDAAVTPAAAATTRAGLSLAPVDSPVDATPAGDMSLMARRTSKSGLLSSSRGTMTSAEDSPTALVGRRMIIGTGATKRSVLVLRHDPTNGLHEVQYTDDQTQAWISLSEAEGKASEPTPAAVPGSPAPANDANAALVGRRITVYWPRDRQWYAGLIAAYNPATREHHIEYDDGDKRSILLSQRKYVLMQSYSSEVIGRRILVRPKISGMYAAEWYLATIMAAAQSGAGKWVHTIKYEQTNHQADIVLETAPFHWVVDIDYMDCSLDGLMGKRIWVYWVKDRMIYEGTISMVSPKEGEGPDLTGDNAEISITYDDGDIRKRRLRTVVFSWADDRTAGKPAAPGLVGLRNMGNTCYLNAVLQCLSHLPQLTQPCIDRVIDRSICTTNKLGMKGRMAIAYAMLVRELWSDTITDVAPGFVKSLVSEKDDAFLGMDQHDAHEVMVCILDGIHEDLRHPEQEASASAGAAAGAGEHKTIDSAAVAPAPSAAGGSEVGGPGRTTLVHELFYLTTQLLEFVHKKRRWYQRPVTVDASLTDCLESYCSPEEIGTSQEWKCEACHKVSTARSAYWCGGAPPILIINLKRFEYHPEQRKLTARIIFPLTGFDIAPYLAKNSVPPGTTTVYNLVGCVTHHGSLERGHYTAYAKLPNGKWYFFDDDETLAVEETELEQDNVQRAAYLLFYARAR